jgi:type IV pilus assembly protein PilC
MPAYQYKARDRNSRVFCGTYDNADSVAALRNELARVGLTLLKARRKSGSRARQQKIKQTDVVTFLYQLAGMCSAGLPIVRCFEALEGQVENDTLKAVVADVRQKTETGMPLQKAFEPHKEIFSEFFVGMLEAAEAGGKLAGSLEMAAEYLEKQAGIRQKVKNAFAYPVVVCVVTALAMAGLLTFVVPVFEKLYRQANLSLPLPTKVLIVLSGMLGHFWWTLPLLAAAGYYGLRHLMANPQFRLKWDMYKLDMPVMGKLYRMILVSRFVRTFGMLGSTGVPLVKALAVASEVAHNARVADIAKDIQDSVKAGCPVSSAMRKYDIFPPTIVELAASGEEAGSLTDMLGRGVDFLDREIDHRIQSLLIKLEPALTVMMGSVVGFVLLGIYLPLFDYLSQSGH